MAKFCYAKPRRITEPRSRQGVDPVAGDRLRFRGPQNEFDGVRVDDPSRRSERTEPEADRPAAVTRSVVDHVHESRFVGAGVLTAADADKKW